MAAVKPSERTKESLECDICKMIFDDEKAYQKHIETGEHKKNLMKFKYAAKYLEAKHNLANNIPVVNPKVDLSDSDTEDPGDIYFCQACNKLCCGKVSYKLHLSGKLHAKGVRDKKLKEKVKNQKILQNYEEPPEDDPLYEFGPQPVAVCTTCNKKFTGYDALLQHNRSETHQKKVKVQEMMKKMEETGELKKHKPKPMEENSEDDSESESFATCDVCNKSFSGLVPYKQHLESDTHKKQVKIQKELVKLDQLSISKREENKLYCTECSKCFSGPIPFKAHLKSTSHSKLQKKKDLLVNLQKSVPEMVQSSVGKFSNSDSDEESDEEKYLCCSICHVGFSGPESAQDHFNSKKHLKAVKELKRLNKMMKKKEKSVAEAASSASSSLKPKMKSAKVSESSDDDFEQI